MSSADFLLNFPADISALPSPGSATAEASLEGVSTAAMTPFGGGGKRHLTIPGYASGVRRRMLATAPRQSVENTTGHASPWIDGRGERIRPSGLYVPNVALYQAKLHPANRCGTCAPCPPAGIDAIPQAQWRRSHNPPANSSKPLE